MDFKDKVTLITGASSGIGRQLAIDLAARGASVIGCARSEKRLQETLLQMKRTNPSAAVFVCDVSDSKQVKAMVHKVLSQFGKIDILINNAGFGHYQSLTNLPLDSIEEMVRTNLLGTIHCTKEALPSMVERRSGHIVNVSSVSGKIGTPHMSSYCATKFALNGLSESLYHELKPLGTHVSVICPGPVRTNFRVLYDHLAPKPPSFMVLSVDEVSRAVIRAIERRKFEVIIPRWLALACLVKALMPSFFRLVAAGVLRLRSTDPESRTGNQDREIQTRQ